MWQLGDCKMFKLGFIGKDPITVGAIHESPAVPKSKVYECFSLYGRFVNRPYNLFKHPDKP